MHDCVVARRPTIASPPEKHPPCAILELPHGLRAVLALRRVRASTTRCTERATVTSSHHCSTIYRSNSIFIYSYTHNYTLLIYIKCFYKCLLLVHFYTYIFNFAFSYPTKPSVFPKRMKPQLLWQEVKFLENDSRQSFLN